MGLTPVSANLLGLGDSALYPSGVSGSGQAATPYSATAVTPGDTATLSSSSGNAAGATNGLYDLPSAVIFRIQLDRLAFEFTQTSTAPTASSSAHATSNPAATDAADGGGKFRKALEALGLDPKTIHEFLRIGKMLKRFDPAAYRDFVQQLENLANALQADHSSATTPASSDTQTPAAAPQPAPENAGQATQPATQQASAPNPAEAPATQFQVDLTSFQLTETQIQITDTQGKNGQTLDVSAETLNVNFAELQAALAPGQEATGAPQGSANSTNSTDSQSQGAKVNVNA